MSRNIFINATLDNPEPDAESRRKIRSQAMRDYRRRQRVEEEDDDETDPDGSPSSLSSPQQSSASGSRRESRQESRHRKGSNTSLPLKPEALRRQSSGTSREDMPHLEDLSVAKGKRPSPSSGLRGETRSKSPRKQKKSEEPRAQHGTFGSFTISLPKPNLPSSSTGEDVDPLSSPGQLEQMLSICETYNRWLISSTATDTEPSMSQVRGPWDNPTSQMLLFALCLKSIGHLDAINPSQVGGNRRLFKTRVLALANKRLKNPAKALEDKTIGALACLTSYEISRGSNEAMMHLSGLSQIIKLRGAVEKIGNQGGLYMFLEMLDLIHAVYFHTAPMYTSADKSRPSSNQQTPQLQPWDAAGGLDQQTLDEISDFIMNIPEMDEEGGLPDPLQFQPEPAVTPSSFEAEVEQWHQFLVQAAQSIAPSYDGSLAYACGLAAGLHLATTSAITAHPIRLQQQTDELFRSLAALPDDAWDAFQMLHVRILLTALSSTQNPSHKSWYNSHLTRRLFQLELDNWSTAKGLMLRFIDMQAMARQPRTKAVRTMVNDIEIVVDSSEARENGWEIQTGMIEPGLDAPMTDFDVSGQAGPAGSQYGLDPDLR